MRFFSEKTNYCLNALIKMAKELEKPNPKPILQVKDLAETPPLISKNYLVQLLILLKNQGIVESERGKMGGYKLIKKPSEIRVLDVIEAVEGTINFGELPKDSPILSAYWLKKEQELREIFYENLSDLLNLERKLDYSI